MRAMVLKNFGEPLVLSEVPNPRLLNNEVLVRIATCGVCGTDLKIINGLYKGIKLPHIIGHEMAGEIVEVGKAVTQCKIGQRVACYFYLYCGECINCLAGRESLCLNLKGRLGFTSNGGMCEYVALPAENCIPIPNGVDYAEAGITMDAVATAYHAVVIRGQIRTGEWAVVMGVGGVGQHITQIASHFGAKVIAVDIDQEKLNLAKESGAVSSILFNPENYKDDIKRITGLIGPDVVIDTVSHTIAHNVSILRPGGRLVMVGYILGRNLSVGQHELIQKECSIIPSRASSRNDVVEALKLVKEKKVKPIISYRYKLEHLNEALTHLKSGKVLGRIVINVS